MVICNICNSTFTRLYTLEQHQKNAKYCKKLQNVSCEYCNMIISKNNVNIHKENCINYLKSIIKDLIYNEQMNNEKILKLEQQNIDLIHNEQMTNEKILKLEQQNIDLISKLDLERIYFQDELKELTIKLIDKPTINNNYSNSKNTNTKIDIFNTLTPLKDIDFIESASKLTLDHVRNGVEGYAKFSIENPLKDKLLCVDYPRKKISYKDENDNKIEEYKFENILPKIFLGIKDVNKELLEIVMNEIDIKYNNYSNTVEEYEDGSKEEKDYSDLLDAHYNKMMEYTNIMCDCRSISNGKLNNKLAKEITDIILNKIPRKC